MTAYARLAACITVLCPVACSSATEPAQIGPGSLLRWNVPLSREVATVGNGLPSYAGSTVAIFATGGSAIALDARTGDRRWAIDDPMFAIPNLGQFLPDGASALALYPGGAMAVDPATGTVRWRRADLPASRRGAFSISAGEVFFGGSVGDVGTAIAFSSGVSRSSPLHPPGADPLARSSNLLAAGDTLYSRIFLESRANSVVGQLWLGRYDRATGRQLQFLRFPTDSIALLATMLLAGDHVFISDLVRNEVWAWNRFDGTARRIHSQRGNGGGNLGSVQVSGDTLVVPAINQNLYAYSIRDARLLFSVPAPASIADATICGDVIYMQHSYIEAISRTTGRSLGKVLDVGTSRMSTPTKGPGYMFGYSPTRAYALSCPA
jgi:outer membrane protein assembly factor BamB